MTPDQNTPTTTGERSGLRPAEPAEVERAEFAFYAQYLRPGMIVLDVGAHVGMLTQLFAQLVHPQGQVHAFEASAAVFDRLQTACRAAAPPSVTLNRLAVTDQEGTVRLNVYDETHLGWNTLADRPLEKYGIDVEPPDQEEVPATTVDVYCATRSLGHVDLLKIDVEGAEFRVLKGARRMLEQQRIGCVLFEFGCTTLDMGDDPKEIQSYAEGLGYVLRNVVERDPLFPVDPRTGLPCFAMLVGTPG